ncbi:MAG: pyridoxamine 5'-phosphate oxidase family protein [Candidatus Cloacimonadales bacterium]|nr:pyridoxamine 5'-phosphate oxidase family protein [Candidatus Cloacimonadales bacterium]
MKAELKKEIFGFFKQTQPVYLSTVDGNKPRVRPVTLIWFEDKFRIATGSSDAKVKQLYSNGNVEFCLSIKDEKNIGYIRIAGTAEIVEDIADKKLILKNIDFIKYFWKEADDPDYTLLKIEMQEIEYLPIGQMLTTRLKV